MSRVDDLSVFNISEDMILEKEGEDSIVIDTFYHDDLPETIINVSKAGAHIPFRYRDRNCVKCSEPITAGQRLIVTTAHYVTACYLCEEWSIYERKSLVDNGGSNTWGIEE